MILPVISREIGNSSMRLSPVYSFGREQRTEFVRTFLDPNLAMQASAYLGHGRSTLNEDGQNPILPATPIVSLGDPSFTRDFNLTFAYVAGAMANGIASVALVKEMARAGMLGILGAAGLKLEVVRAAVVELKKTLGSQTFGVNLIHSPQEAGLEDALVDLLIELDVRVAEASAFLAMSPSVVRYRLHGIHRGPDGRVCCPNRVIAKVSRTEVARQFMEPASERILRLLVEQGRITPEEATLAREVPIAQDITAEADSGGHTDNRPALTLLPTILALRDEIQCQWTARGSDVSLRVGAAGGIGTPMAAAAAFVMGAAYIVTGTINQACIESGTSDLVRQMLAEALQTDVAMAPAADMFEAGIKVQVLKRGTMFPMRAQKLYELYRKHKALEEIPEAEREVLETQFFKRSVDAEWQSTRAYFSSKDPKQIARAEADPHHKMALVFRSYLGQASHWANQGIPERRFDYQVWCGSAMGAFNEWVKGSYLEPPANRRAVSVALNILYGATLILRAQILRMQGIHVPPELVGGKPVSEIELWSLIDKRIPN